MDLLGALVLLKHAINTVSTTARPQITRSGPQPTQTKPYSGYVSRPAAVQAAQHGSSQLPDEDAAAVQEMLRGIHAQLGALAAAFDAEPLRVRQLARYHRARREAWERQQMDVFVLDWGCAEGRSWLHGVQGVMPGTADWHPTGSFCSCMRYRPRLLLLATLCLWSLQSWQQYTKHAHKCNQNVQQHSTPLSSSHSSKSSVTQAWLLLIPGSPRRWYHQPSAC